MSPTLDNEILTLKPSEQTEGFATFFLEAILDDDALGIASAKYARKQLKLNNMKVAEDDLPECDAYWTYQTMYTMDILHKMLTKMVNLG